MIIKRSVGMEKRTLKELAKGTFLGMAVRPPKDPDAPVFEVVNIKDLHDGHVDITSLEKREIASKRDPKAERTKVGDVLVAIKGSQFKAAVVDNNSEGYIISSNLISLRLDTSKAIPNVVAAYLNSPMGQHKLGIISKGTAIPSISQIELLRISIPTPPIEQQLALSDYLDSVQAYLTNLRREELITRNIRDYVIFQQMREK